MPFFSNYSLEKYYWCTIIHVQFDQYIFIGQDITQTKLLQIEREKNQQQLEMLVNERTKQLKVNLN